MIYRKTDENGLFVADAIDPEIEERYKHLYIIKPVTEGFYHPRWNGEEWVEGLSDEDIYERTNSALQELNNLDYIMLAMTDLDMQRAIDKTEIELAITELAEVLMGGM